MRSEGEVGKLKKMEFEDEEYEKKSSEVGSYKVKKRSCKVKKIRSYKIPNKTA